MRFDIKPMVGPVVGMPMVLMLLATSALQAGPFPSRPRHGVVVDETSTLSRNAVAEIERVSTKVRNATNGEIMVAIIQTTSGKNHRQFATDLFNRWKIGDRTKDNGVLVFVAMRDRKAEIILGDGMDGRAEIKKAEAIMSDYMMPQFKKGRPEAGVLAAVSESGRRFFGIDPKANVAASNNSRNDVNRDVSATSAGQVVEPNTGELQVAEFPESGFPEGGVSDNVDRTPNALAAIQGDDAIDQDQVMHQVHNNNNNNFRRQGQRGGGLVRLIAGLFGGGLTLTGLGFCWKKFGRNRARTCELCKFPMVKLSESEDDAHLDPNEQVEERIGSVDYDVWSCTACEHVVKSRHAAFFTRYAQCPHCRSRTKSSTKSVVRSATTVSSGLAEVTESCLSCNYHHVSQQVIPRIVQQSSSSGISSGGGGGFSGGGSSSGGGASGSW